MTKAPVRASVLKPDGLNSGAAAKPDTTDLAPDLPMRLMLLQGFKAHSIDYNVRPKPMARSKTTQPTFEQAIEQLEAITEKIESGDVGLAESLTQYEHGMKLIGRCRAMLDDAEKRIAKLGADPKGGLTLDEAQSDEDA